MPTPEVTRRDFLSLGAALAAQSVTRSAADVTLRIGEINLEVAPGRFIPTLAYNGQSPGPLLRMTEGKSVTVDVFNQTREPEMVHWHGFQIPPQVDGAHEEGTPMVQGMDHRRYVFTPGPSGTRWYHTHAIAGHNLHRGTYSGQFGMVVVEPRANPARYELEVPIVLHEWDGFFSAENAMDVEYNVFTVNGKMLGSGEPVRVKSGQRVLFRVLNASANRQHRLALAGHTFEVLALDGNPVRTPRRVPLIDLSPGERVDALVEMDSPGVWIFGEVDDHERASGAGIVVEYGGATGFPNWIAPPPFTWNYTVFGGQADRPEPASIHRLVFERRFDGHGWSINGKPFPQTDLIPAVAGRPNRLIFDNRSDMAHPVHLHRHTFEITKYAGESSAGVFKDVVMVPEMKVVEVDFLANSPGPSLFHCHHQFHMDFGFMAVMQY
ncbi:MAG TPA: multicopper oxidase family protein [Bryobacteraceae bacterium]|nr:multicopper oxidase family protein [Bryobacteraceae bacterium]